MTDFSKTLVRCSAIGLIMSDPRGYITEKQLETIRIMEAKAKLTDKQREEYLTLLAKREESYNLPLSDSCKSYLVEVFAFCKWGKLIKPTLEGNKYLQKGKMVENDSIALVSFLDETPYEKNEERLNNEWLTGEVDLYDGELLIKADKVIDVKSSWSLDTFLANLVGSPNPLWWWQMQGYLDLCNSQQGELHICLVSTPEPLINDEKRRLFYRMNCVTDQDPKYLEAAQQLELNMTFDDIPANERRLIFKVDRDDDAIERIHRKVERCREWLGEYENEWNAKFRLPQVL